MMSPLIIVGAGGLGSQLVERVISDPANKDHWTLAGFYDDRAEKAKTILNWSAAIRYPLQHFRGRDEIPFSHEPKFVMAIGNPNLKEAYAKKVLDWGGQFVSLLHVDNERSVTAKVGKSILFKNCVVGPNVEIGDFVWIDRNCIVGHDCVIGNFCHIGVNVCIGGATEVGDNTVIHSGSMISNGIKIGSHCEIGLGSVILRDVADGSIMLGNPARKIGNV